ncbi:MAG: hypothetical protein ACE5KV_03160 [Thermoplasmata archaeon]
MESKSINKRRAGSARSEPESSVKRSKEQKATPISNRGQMGAVSSSNPISTNGIKTFVSSRFPPGHALRETVLAEREKLEPEEFLAKMETWLILLNQGT